MDQKKLTLLLISDDSNVRRFHFRPFWIKLALYLPLLLLAAILIIAYAAYTFRSDYVDMQNAYRGMEGKYLEAKGHLDRLRTLEKFLNSVDQPEAPEVKGKTFTAPKKQPAAQPQIDLEKLFGNVDMHIVKITNVGAEPLKNALRLRLSINNLRPAEEPVTGEVKATLISRQGQAYPIRMRSGDVSFQIRRFKSITAVLPLPSGLTRSDIFGIKLTAVSDDKKILTSRTYPLSGILYERQ